jgi:hypothetical protein
MASEYNRKELGRQAAELGFIRDTFEKVSRLAGVLTFFERERFDLNTAKDRVKRYLEKVLELTDEESHFLLAFGNGEYRPDLLFEADALERVRNHPMALWKMQVHDKNR